MKNKEKIGVYPSITLPEEISGACGFSEKDKLELHGCTGALVIMKSKMTSIEVGNCIESFCAMGAELSTALAKSAGICNGCGSLNGKSPAECVASCPLCYEIFDDRQSINIPDYLLEEADIPLDAKLTAFADVDSGEIVVTQAYNDFDLRDMPNSVLTVMAASGVCLAELDERILLEDIVYGN